MEQSIKCLFVFGSNRYRVVIPSSGAKSATLRALKDAFVSSYKANLPSSLLDQGRCLFEIYDGDFKEYVTLEDQSEVPHLATIRVTPLSHNQSTMEPMMMDGLSESGESVRGNNGYASDSGEERDDEEDERDDEEDEDDRDEDDGDDEEDDDTSETSNITDPLQEKVEILSIDDSALSLQTVTSADPSKNGPVKFHDAKLRQLEVFHKSEKMLLLKKIRDNAQRFWDRDNSVWKDIAYSLSRETNIHYNVERCKGAFLHMINQYIFLLKRCKNMSDKEVIKIWPFYQIFHYEINLELHCPITVAKILLLKDQFTLSQPSKQLAVLNVVVQNQSLFKTKRKTAWETIVKSLFELKILHSYEYGKVLFALQQILNSLKKEYCQVLRESRTVEDARTWLFFNAFHYELNLGLLFHPNDPVVAVQEQFNRRLSQTFQSKSNLSSNSKSSTANNHNNNQSSGNVISATIETNTADDTISKTRKQKIALIHSVSNQLDSLQSLKKDSDFWKLIAEDMEEFLPPSSSESSCLIWETLFLQLFQRYLHMKSLKMTEEERRQTWFYYTFFSINDFSLFYQRFKDRFQA